MAKIPSPALRGTMRIGCARGKSTISTGAKPYNYVVWLFIVKIEKFLSIILIKRMICTSPALNLHIAELGYWKYFCEKQTFSSKFCRLWKKSLYYVKITKVNSISPSKGLFFNSITAGTNVNILQCIDQKYNTCI